MILLSNIDSLVDDYRLNSTIQMKIIKNYKQCYKKTYLKKKMETKRNKATKNENTKKY